MTKAGQTTDYTAADHLKDISFYLGRAPDVIIVNNGTIPQNILEWYQSHTENLLPTISVKMDLKAK